MVQKRLNDSVSFFASVFTNKMFSTRNTGGGIEEQQVRNYLEKLNVF